MRGLIKLQKQLPGFQCINPLFLPTKTYLSHFITQPIRNKWQEQWSSQQQLNHLAKLKPFIAPCPSSNQSSRRLEIILTHLRIHLHVCPHLLPLYCDHCAQDNPLSLPHIFNCPTLAPLHLTHQIPSHYTEVLTDNNLRTTNILSTS